MLKSLFKDVDCLTRSLKNQFGFLFWESAISNSLIKVTYYTLPQAKGGS